MGSVNKTCSIDLSANEVFLPLTLSKSDTSFDIDAHYATLKRTGVIPSLGPKPAKADVDAYVKADKAMLARLKDAHAYYNAQYKCAIESYMSGGPVSADDVQLLNVRLYVLLKLYDKILSEKKNTTAANTNEIRAQIQNIQRQSDLIRKMTDDESGESKRDIYMRMIEYTKEKAAVTNNLMQLYGFLNIVAIGILFYVYRST